MFLASKIVWAGIACILLAMGVLGLSTKSFALEISLSKEELAAHANNLKQMQQTLHDKGHYRGKVDGAFGLRTRASIRAYQKAENLPITGQVDFRTADRLGVRPESSWGSFKGEQKVGDRSDRAGGEIKRGKPSAGIRRAQRRASNPWRKEVSRAAAAEDNRGDDTNKQQAENDKRDQ